MNRQDMKSVENKRLENTFNLLTFQNRMKDFFLVNKKLDLSNLQTETPL